MSEPAQKALAFLIAFTLGVVVTTFVFIASGYEQVPR